MRIAGVDEAGRGPLAGPVVAAAVVLPDGFQHPEVKDSKQLSARKREILSELIKKHALDWAIVAVGARRIDQLNIREATKLCMRLAIERVQADFALIDGNMAVPCRIPGKTVVKGDQKHIEISAASILAKVYRDQLMQVLDQKYPGYDLGKHAGYPTVKHRARIAELGPCPVHRRTFDGVKEHCHDYSYSVLALKPRLETGVEHDKQL